ncbi:MAG: carboxypeptidase-like regulatory domain-containing protein [Methanobacteriota archaeon]
MKKNLLILLTTLLLLTTIYPPIHAADEPQIILTAPSEVDEGGQFEVKTLLTGMGTGEPIEPGIVTIIFLGETRETNQHGVIILNAPYVNADTEYQIIARKTGYPDTIKMITIQDTTTPPPDQEQPQLHITVTSTITEQETFTILITTNDLPTTSATVYFNDDSKTTNDEGIVEFTAPSVQEDATYTITVRKPEHLSDTVLITVLNQEPTQNPQSWIYGTITDTTDDPVDGARICIISTTTENCTETNEDGEYNISVPPGHYSIRAEKTGYVTTITYQLDLQEQTAYELSFILENIEETTPSETYNTGALAIQWGVENQIIGAQLTTTEETTQGYIYNPALTLNVSREKKSELTFTITGPDNTPGTIIAVRIGNTNTYFNTTLLELSNLIITYDGIPIPMTTNFDDFFNTSSTSTTPHWAAVITGETLTALVKIPHFSTHEIRIYTVEHMIETLGGITAIILYSLTIIVLAILIAIPIVRLWKKIE